MNYATDVSPIIVDVETAPLENARDYIDAPDLSDIQAPKNYVKAEAIADYVEREKAKRIADFDFDVTNKSALDFNMARIVAIGTWSEHFGLMAMMCASEAEEAAALDAFWRMAKRRLIVGFRVREFDLPMLMQRSLYLGVNFPQLDLGRYARGSGIVDIYDRLTFQDIRQEAVMRRSVHAFCRRFGIQVTDEISGKDIPALVAAGDWAAVESHVRSDVLLEVELARKLRIIELPVAEAVI